MVFARDFCSFFAEFRFLFLSFAALPKYALVPTAFGANRVR